MYLFLELQGQGTSFSPGRSGLPTEWTQGTKKPSPRASRTADPIRVMIRIDTAT